MYERKGIKMREGLRKLPIASFSGGFKGGGAAPYWHIFFQKAACLRVKGIYFVVRICDK